MFRHPQISPLKVVLCLTDVIDLVSPRLQKHHKQVGYAAWRLAREMDLAGCRTARTVMAGLTHDCGAFTLEERERLADFEAEFEAQDMHSHARRGAALLEQVDWLGSIAAMVRRHHLHWENDDGTAPPGSHILHVADRVAVSIDPGRSVLAQAPAIRERIRKHSGRMFKPDVVDAFMRASDSEVFWFDMTSKRLRRCLLTVPCRRMVDLDRDGRRQLMRLFAHIIDFRSRYTATHSAGVAAAATAMARHMGFNDVECNRMTAAGHMHDMGKLAVSAEALQKRGELNKQQEAAMKRHPYLGYRAMETVPELRQVSRWAFLHHERVDGSGYPFGLSKEELPLGARIMAAADVFGALNEDRPYRNRKSPDEALAILKEEAADGKLDTTVVEAVEGHLDDIAAAVEVAREEASEHYDQVSRVLQSL